MSIRLSVPSIDSCGTLCCFYSPSVVEETVVCVEEGRHPIIDLLLGEGEQYVPNNTEMSVS